MRFFQLDKITTDVKQFLQDYDQIILHKDPYRGVFHSYLREIRTKVKQLLLKFEAAPYDDGSAKPDKELFCCGVSVKFRVAVKTMIYPKWSIISSSSWRSMIQQN